MLAVPDRATVREAATVPLCILRTGSCLAVVITHTLDLTQYPTTGYGLLDLIKPNQPFFGWLDLLETGVCCSCVQHEQNASNAIKFLQELANFPPPV